MSALWNTNSSMSTARTSATASTRICATRISSTARCAAGSRGTRTGCSIGRFSGGAEVTSTTGCPAAARVSATVCSRSSPKTTCTPPPADSIAPCRYWRVLIPVDGMRTTSRKSSADASAEPTAGPAPTKSAEVAVAKSGARARTCSRSSFSVAANSAPSRAQPSSGAPPSHASASMPSAATVAV